MRGSSNPDMAFYDALAKNGHDLRTLQDDLGYQGSKAHRPLYPHGGKAVRKSMALSLINEVSERQETTHYGLSGLVSCTAGPGRLTAIRAEAYPQTCGVAGGQAELRIQGIRQRGWPGSQTGMGSLVYR